MTETRLTIEGVGPDEISTGFLVSIMAAAEAEQLDVHGVSIDWCGSSGETADDRE